MECFLSFKNCALRLKTVPVCLAQLLRCQSVAMQASRLPFALNLTKTTSAIQPDRLVHWYYQEDPRSVRAVAQRIPPSRELDRSLESMISQSMHRGHLERSRELLDLVSDQKTKNALWKKIEKVEQERTE